MAKEKALSTIVKEQTVRIAELEKQLASEKSSKDYYSKMYSDNQQVVDGIHEILDDLGIRGYKDESKYNRIPLAVRLFSWAMKLSNKGE